LLGVNPEAAGVLVMILGVVMLGRALFVHMPGRKRINRGDKNKRGFFDKWVIWSLVILVGIALLAAQSR
jgi:hypothetical protein